MNKYGHPNPTGLIERSGKGHPRCPVCYKQFDINKEEDNYIYDEYLDGTVIYAFKCNNCGWREIPY